VKNILRCGVLLVLVSCAAWGQSTVQVVNPPSSPVPVVTETNLQHDGTFFSVGPGVNETLTVPAGVVLTDAYATFSIPESLPNEASLFVEDSSGKVLVYQIVNNTTYEAHASFTSGIPSGSEGIEVILSCYNISGNLCQGALMWSGYKPASSAPGSTGSTASGNQKSVPQNGGK
jgi:hypothetical protein